MNMGSQLKNRLNLIQYEMEGERNRHDSQMILAKLRKLENRAELHRAQYELTQTDKRSYTQRLKKSHSLLNQSHIEKTFKNQPYLKIYKTYLEEKQAQMAKKIFEEEEDSLKEYLKTQHSHNRIRYFSQLKKHPQILNYTTTRLKEKQGILKKQQQAEKRQDLFAKLKANDGDQEYLQQKIREQNKDQIRQIKDPEKVIQRQLTKFFVKKNSGKLSQQAKINRRSVDLLQRQSKIVSLIGQYKIGKEDNKKMQYRFNQMANIIAISDRKRSLQNRLPALNFLKQSKLMPLNN